MTFKQKIEHDYPDKIDPECLGGVEGCPHNYGYESCDNRPCIGEGCSNLRCESCWNREIPGTKPLTYEHTAVPIGKVVEMTEFETGVEFKIEPINSNNEKEKNMAKKTKAELEKELETVKESKAELEKELKNLEKYKQYEDMAGEVHAIYMAYVHAGFSEEQAYDLLKTMIENAGKITFNTAITPSYRGRK